MAKLVWFHAPVCKGVAWNFGCGSIKAVLHSQRAYFFLLLILITTILALENVNTLATERKRKNPSNVYSVPSFFCQNTNFLSLTWTEHVIAVFTWSAFLPKSELALIQSKKSDTQYMAYHNLHLRIVSNAICFYCVSFHFLSFRMHQHIDFIINWKIPIAKYKFAIDPQDKCGCFNWKSQPPAKKMFIMQLDVMFF